MDFKQFDDFQRELHQEIVSIGATKGKEYAHSDDRFANFRRLSEQLGLKDYQVGWVYAAKHIDSIISYIKEGKTFSEEGIRGRFKDAILYFELILGMIEDDKLNGLTVSEEVAGLTGYEVGYEVTSNFDLIACSRCNHIFTVNEKAYQCADYKNSNKYYCFTCLNKVAP